MLERSSPKPLYVQLEEIISKKLQSGEWAPNAMIPSENELSREFGISRVTVRNVINKFVQDDMLYRIQGKGTFVSEKKNVLDFPAYVGIREQLEKMGYETSTRLLSIECCPVSSGIQKRFGLGEVPFYVLRRLRSIKDEPFSLHVSYVPEQVCPGLENEDLENEQLCHILDKKYGLRRSRVVQTLGTVTAQQSEATLLNMKPNQSLLLLEDSVYSSTNSLFEFTKVLFKGSQTKLRLEFD